jgi:hypothetical protein
VELTLRTILAIESGGIRGIIPALVVNQIEQACGRPAGELFDLIAGCGSGSILALALSMSIETREILRFHHERGNKVYRGNWLTSMLRQTPLNAVLGDLTSPGELRSSLRDLFGPSTFSTCRVPTTCVNSLGSMIPFESWKATPEFTCAEIAAQCTINVREGNCFAGTYGLMAAKALWPTDRFRVVHIGTGIEERLEPSNQGRIGWGRIIVPMIMQISMNTQEGTLKRLGAEYVKFHPSLGTMPIATDDARKKSLDSVIALGLAYLREDLIRERILGLAVDLGYR